MTRCAFLLVIVLGPLTARAANPTSLLGSVMTFR